MLFFFGMPSRVMPTREQNYLAKELVKDADKIAKKNKTIKTLSFLGLLLMLVGFSLQFLSYWV